MRVVAAMYRERGYEQCSMAALAKRVGISAPAFYHYFGSKEEILAAFLDYTVTDLIGHVSSRVRGRTWGERLASFMRAYVDWQLRQTPFPRAYDRVFALGHLRNSLPNGLRNRESRIERRFYEICRNIVAGGVAAGEFREVPVAPTAFAIIGIGDYVLGWYRFNRELDPVRLGALYADLAVRMVRRDTQPRRRRASVRRTRR